MFALALSGVPSRRPRRQGFRNLIFTTRLEPAVTPVATPLARVVKKTLILAGAIGLAIGIGHMIGPREEQAAHLRSSSHPPLRVP